MKGIGPKVIRKLFAGASVLAVTAIAVLLMGMSSPDTAQAAPAAGLSCHNNVVTAAGSPGDWPVNFGRNNDVAVCQNASIVKPAGYGQTYFVCRGGTTVVALNGSTPGVPLGYHPGDQFIWSLTDLGQCHPPA